MWSRSFPINKTVNVIVFVYVCHSNKWSTIGTSVLPMCYLGYSVNNKPKPATKFSFSLANWLTGKRLLAWWRSRARSRVSGVLCNVLTVFWHFQNLECSHTDTLTPRHTYSEACSPAYSHRYTQAHTFWTALLARSRVLGVAPKKVKNRSNKNINEKCLVKYYKN